MTRISDFKSSFIAGVRPNLFRMEVSGFPEKFSFMCKASQVPSKTIEVIEVPYLNMKHKIAGINTFETLTTSIIMDTDLLIRNTIEGWMENIRSNDSMYGSTPLENEKTGSLFLMNQSGDDIANWDYIGMWPTALGNVELSYETGDSIAEYTCEFAYTYWTRIK